MQIALILNLYYYMKDEETKMGSHSASGGYKYRGLVLWDGG
jgi:hypothetical protein